LGHRLRATRTAVRKRRGVKLLKKRQGTKEWNQRVQRLGGKKLGGNFLDKPSERKVEVFLEETRFKGGWSFKKHSEGERNVTKS